MTTNSDRNTRPAESLSTAAVPPLNPDTLLSSATATQVLEAEKRRDTFRTEAALNLAVGITLQRHGITEIRIYPNELLAFQNNFNTDSQIHDDGSFTISQTPKE